MEYLLPVVFLIILCRHTYALDVLPAPINVSMDSKNFRHELKWDPGPGTPPGTYYKVFTRFSGGRPKSKDFQKTSGVLKLSNEPTYRISVQGVYNGSLESLESKALNFSPYKDTKIDTPRLSVVGGDHRLELNISLPKAHLSAKIPDIQKFYDAKVTISWNKAGDKPVSRDMTDSSMVLENLEAGVKYCVTVHMRIRINPNTLRSDCFYASTSEPEPIIAPRVLGITVPVLVLLVLGMVGLLVVLHYVGFLCGIKARLPAILLMVLTNGYLNTPETTIPEHVYINPAPDKQRARKAQPAVEGTGLEDSDEDEEDEEDAGKGEHMYFNRAAELSSDSDSQDAPGDSSRNSSASACPTVARVLRAVEWPLPGSHGQPGIRGHRVKGPVMLDKDPNGTVGRTMTLGEWNEEGVCVDGRWKEKGKEEAEMCDVNLFSVTLLKEDNSGNINLCSEIFGGFKEASDHEMDVDSAPRGSLPPLHDPEPHSTSSSPASRSCTPSDTEEVVLSILDPGQPHDGETGNKAGRGREGAGTSCGDLISHGGETDNEEEQEEEDSCGYLGRY